MIVNIFRLWGSQAGSCISPYSGCVCVPVARTSQFKMKSYMLVESKFVWFGFYSTFTQNEDWHWFKWIRDQTGRFWRVDAIVLSLGSASGFLAVCYCDSVWLLCFRVFFVLFIMKITTNICPQNHAALILESVFHVLEKKTNFIHCVALTSWHFIVNCCTGIL